MSLITSILSVTSPLISNCLPAIIVMVLVLLSTVVYGLIVSFPLFVRVNVACAGSLVAVPSPISDFTVTGCLVK